MSSSHADEIARRQHVKRILARRRMYQFGQPPETTQLVAGGSVACGDTTVQLMVRIWTGERVPLDLVRRASRVPFDKPNTIQGLQRALSWFKVPYRVRFDVPPGEIVDIIRERGPVGFVYQYWSHPEWAGYWYGGQLGDGVTRVNGRAVAVGLSRPLAASGKNQLTGFTTGHFALAAAARRTGGHGISVLVRDPNHNSTVRPERPAWDKITMRQFRRMLESQIPVSGHTAVLVPERVLQPWTS